jgi:hypothetical protein
MAAFIQASPTAEFERLASTVQNWPVSNADERKERWPKELSRRMFPTNGTEVARRQVNEALSRVGITVKPVRNSPTQPQTGYATAAQPNYSSSAPQSSSFTPRQSQSSNTNARQQDPSNMTRNRNSYVQPVGPDSVFDNESVSSFSSEDEDPKSSVKFGRERKPIERERAPIERERKPYTAKEGTGKIYDNGTNMTRSKSNSIPTSVPRELPNVTKASTVASESQPHPSSQWGNIPIRPRERSTGNNERSAGKRSNGGPTPPYGTSPSSSYQFEGPPFNPQSGYYHGAPQLNPMGQHYAPPHGAEENQSYTEGRKSSRDEEDRKYARFDEEYRNIRGSVPFANGNNPYGGNPPLGAGQRHYG